MRASQKGKHLIRKCAALAHAKVQHKDTSGPLKIISNLGVRTPNAAQIESERAGEAIFGRRRKLTAARRIK